MASLQQQQYVLPPAQQQMYYPKKLFIGGLHPMTTASTVKNYYERFGKVVDCIVKENPFTGLPRCFGYVVFKHAISADFAISCFPHVIDGKVVDTKRAFPPPGIQVEDDGTWAEHNGGLQFERTQLMLERLEELFNDMTRPEFLVAESNPVCEIPITVKSPSSIVLADLVAELQREFVVQPNNNTALASSSNVCNANGGKTAVAKAMLPIELSPLPSTSAQFRP